MPRYKMVTQTDTPAEHEAEFRDYYPNVHVADVLKIPGMLGAQLLERGHVLTDRGAPPWKYMVIYDVETADPADMAEAMRRGVASGEIRGNSALLSEQRRTVFYEPLGAPLPGTPAAKPGKPFKMIVQIDTPDEAEFLRYYAQVHVADVVRVPGVLGAQMFRRAHAMTDRGAPPWNYMVIYEIETADPAATAAAIAEGMKAGTIRANMALLKDERKSVFYAPLTPVMPGTPA